MTGKTKGMTAQNRLILLGLILSTVLIVLVALSSVYIIQKKLNQGYRNFGQIIAKTLAIESNEITKDIPEYAKFETLRNHAHSILKSNDDIAYIEFKDTNSNVIYSSKDDYPKNTGKKQLIKVNSPLITKNLSDASVIGSVEVGLSGYIINHITSTTRALLFVAFALAWLVVAAVVWMNTVIITRELRNLHQGVRRIATGEFGYTIEGKDVSSEVKELYDAFNEMSQKLNTYDQKNVENITLERNKFESVLMNIANGVVVCDNYDKVVLVNKHAKELLEVEEADIINTKIQQYCDTNGELCFKEKIDLFKDTPLDEMEDKPLTFNIEVDKKVIKAVISPMFSRSSDYLGYIIVLIDVTKEIEMDKLRSHFISNVSHELRTPVTVLRSYIDTLYNYGGDFDYNTQKEFIGVMNQEIVRLNRMVNDILDFSKYESQDIRLEKTKQAIQPVIEDCVEQMKVLASEHNITISVMTEPDLPEILFNYDSIARVLMNLLSNAIKYSPDGKRIKVKAERSQVGDYIEVSVEDQGPGIPEEYHEKVFDRFFRIENETHSVKGTGLGLHLVKISVEKHHNGQVFLYSKVGEGSTFGFRLPIITKEEEPEEYIPKYHPGDEVHPNDIANDTSFETPKAEIAEPTNSNNYEEDTNGWEISPIEKN
ncbi:HAMP domain-containing protein [bacterium]|nr:HAMP domain-containing protein [bacterium]